MKDKYPKFNDNDFVHGIIKYTINNNSIDACYYNHDFGNKPVVQYVIPYYDTKDGRCFRLVFVYNGGNDKMFAEDDYPIVFQTESILDWLNGSVYDEKLV